MSKYITSSHKRESEFAIIILDTYVRTYVASLCVYISTENHLEYYIYHVQIYVQSNLKLSAVLEKQTYIYIYIYMCVCVCVFTFIRTYIHTHLTLLAC